MNLGNIPVVTPLHFWIPPEVKPLFCFLLGFFLASVLCHARRHLDGM